MPAVIILVIALLIELSRSGMRNHRLVQARWKQIEIEGICKQLITPSDGICEVCITDNNITLWFSLDTFEFVWNGLFHDRDVFIEFTVSYPSDYPIIPPEIRFKTKIEGHPCINAHTGELHNLSEQIPRGWTPVMPILQLLKHIYNIILFGDEAKLYNLTITRNQISCIQPSNWESISLQSHQIPDPHENNTVIDEYQAKLMKLFDTQSSLKDATLISLDLVVCIQDTQHDDQDIQPFLSTLCNDTARAMFTIPAMPGQIYTDQSHTWVIRKHQHFYAWHEEIFAFYQIKCVPKKIVNITNVAHDNEGRIIWKICECDHWIISQIKITKDIRTGVKTIHKQKQQTQSSLMRMVWMGRETEMTSIDLSITNYKISSNQMRVSVDDRMEEALFWKVNSRILYHATNGRASYSMESHNYTMEPGEGGMLGPGIYFAETPDIAMQKSLHGGQAIIQARVDVSGYYAITPQDILLDAFDRFDTVYAPQTISGLRNSEWRVRRSEQVKIIRIIDYVNVEEFQHFHRLANFVI
eukprot:200651_1